MEKLDTHRDDSILEPKLEKKKKNYSPVWNHPWRKGFCDNYLKYYLSNKIIMLMLMIKIVKMQRY